MFAMTSLLGAAIAIVQSLAPPPPGPEGIDTDKLFLEHDTLWIAERSERITAEFPRTISKIYSVPLFPIVDIRRTHSQCVPYDPQGPRCARWSIIHSQLLWSTTDISQAPHIWIYDLSAWLTSDLTRYPDPFEIPQVVAGDLTLALHPNPSTAAFSVDFWAVARKKVVYYLLFQYRMMAYYCNHDALPPPNTTLGPHILTGPRFTFTWEIWTQIATFDCPFKGLFTVYWANKEVYLLTGTGELYVVHGLLNPRDPEVSMKDYVGSGSLNQTYAESRLGISEKRIRVERVPTPSPVRFGVVDRDFDDVYWLCADTVTDSTQTKSRPVAVHPIPDGADGALRDVWRFLPDLVALRKELHPDAKTVEAPASAQLPQKADPVAPVNKGQTTN